MATKKEEKPVKKVVEKSAQPEEKKTAGKGRCGCGKKK